MDKENTQLAVLFSLAMFSQLFLFATAFSNASWSGQERQFPTWFNPSSISSTLDKNLNIIADNLVWSVSTALDEAKGPMLAVFGLQDYQFNYMPRHYNAELHAAVANQEFAQSDDSGQVLGAYQEMDYYSGLEDELDLSWYSLE